MTRILADLPDSDIRHLDALAARTRRSRAATIRDAIRTYLAAHEEPLDWIKRGAGFWKDREDIGDGVDYQRAIREDRSSD